MRFIYNASLLALRTLLRMVSPFHPKAAEMFRGRKDWIQELKTSRLDGKIIWFHCASVGEFEQAKPVIELLKTTSADLRIVITVFSPSGIGPAKKYPLADLVCYLPFDSRKNAERFIDLLRPTMVVFIKYEFWYHFLHELRQRGIPVFSVSSIFRKDQRFFRSNSAFFRSMLPCFDHFFVQTAASKQLLESIGITNVTVSGDTRVDRVIKIAANPLDIPFAAAFKAGEKLLVVGSSWHQDMDILLPMINDDSVKLRYIIAPHELSEGNIRSITSKLSVSHVLFSQADQQTIHSKKVLIIDNIGMLSSLYRYGELAYVGGAFHEGLHNILEPAAYGIPVLFGRSKSNRKYQEAMDLVTLGGAFEVSNSPELKTKIKELLSDPGYMTNTTSIVHSYVRSNSGASERVVNHLKQFLK